MAHTYPIDNNFTYHRPLEGDADKFVQLRAKAKEFAALCGELCPESRELSVARTNIEQAVFWANASIARQGEPA